jgi:hypothetical protein
MAESKLHNFLKREILPDDFLYREIEIYFKRRCDEKLGATRHRPDIYCRSFKKKNIEKNVLLLGEIETGGGNFWWNWESIGPIIKQQWADNTVLFQAFYPLCGREWVKESIEKGKKLEKKYKTYRIHFYPFEMKIPEERAEKIYDAFSKRRKKKDDLKVLKRETNKINYELLKIVKKFLRK